MSYLLRAGLCVVLFVAIGVPANCLHGDVVYTITGFANTIAPDDPNLSPEVSEGESYVAEFLIDSSVLDSNSDPGVGSYAAAILSSSISFSGGYVSQVDFAGGSVTVQQDIFGGAVGLNDVSGLGSILIADLGNAFDSDELLTDPGTQIVGSPLSLWSLTEPTGLITSFSDTGFGPSTGSSGPIVLSVGSAIPEPSTACLLGLGVLSCALRRRK